MKNQRAGRGEPAGSLHPRNLHRGRYDFRQLIAASSALAAFVSLNAHGDPSVDFSDPAAVKALNRALLIAFYGVKAWDIPEGYLCPPIPGRADYLHYLADLLARSNGGTVPGNARVLDIGTGANCIYPLIGHSVYGWHFVGSDIDPRALVNAQRIVDANPGMTASIALRLQTSPEAIFQGVVQPGELFDLTLCNPPFHASLSDAKAGTQRKWKNLGKAHLKTSLLNFGGQGAELWCKGGEEAFICRMIAESVHCSANARWFTTLVSKSATLPAVYRALNQAAVRDQRMIEMAQGKKKSRIVAWTFLDEKQRQAR